MEHEKLCTRCGIRLLHPPTLKRTECLPCHSGSPIFPALADKKSDLNKKTA